MTDKKDESNTSAEFWQNKFIASEEENDKLLKQIELSKEEARQWKHHYEVCSEDCSRLMETMQTLREENKKLNETVKELDAVTEQDAFEASNVFMMREVHNSIAEYIHTLERLYRERVFADVDTNIVDTIKELKIRENDPDHFLYLCKSIDRKRDQFDVLIDAENRLKMHKSIMQDVKKMVSSHLHKFQYFRIVDATHHFE